MSRNKDRCQNISYGTVSVRYLDKYGVVVMSSFTF